LYEFVVMPDHIHAIIEITEVAHSLPAILGSFKSAVTRICRQRNLIDGHPFWQRGYFEHIVRTEKSLLRLRQYILDNPVQLDLDRSMSLLIPGLLKHDAKEQHRL
jgi:REP element-mobilizing transposase RayT